MMTSMERFKPFTGAAALEFAKAAQAAATSPDVRYRTYEAQYVDAEPTGPLAWAQAPLWKAVGSYAVGVFEGTRFVGYIV